MTIKFLSLETLISLMSIATFLGGAIAWYSAKIQKGYAAKRDFEHLKRNFEQLSSAQGLIMKELDTRFDSLQLHMIEIKSLLITKRPE